jgi:hypothetical protein
MDHCLLQSGSGLARGSEQSLNKSPGLVGIKLNLIALIDDLAGNLTDVRNDEFSHRAPLNRGRFLEKVFVSRRHARDKSLIFLLFNYRLHTPNVCLCGTHCKS